MSRYYSKTKNAAMAIFVLMVGCGTVEAQSRSNTHAVNQRDLDGVLQPYFDIDVATTETGIVRKVLVKPGDHVVKDQPLVELDADSILAQIHVKQTEAGAMGKIEQAKAELDLQQLKYDKLTKMLEGGKSSVMEVERAKSDLIIAQGRFHNEEDTLRILKSDVERFEKQLADRTLRAPMDGIVTEIQKQVGEFVAPNSPVVLRLIDTRLLRATFSVQESELATVKVGGIVRIQLSSGLITQGLVEFIPPVADAETGWFMISVKIDNDDGKIIGSRCQRLQ
ncbi:MAG: efflux RND transporter periplasmic adaptor subunit [Pirellulaceae bacterium]|nr:efflux RND transporter periplasmic adaptor subunit [Pirellulaceae bacterium]